MLARHKLQITTNLQKTVLLNSNHGNGIFSNHADSWLIDSMNLTWTHSDLSRTSHWSGTRPNALQICYKCVLEMRLRMYGRNAFSFFLLCCPLGIFRLPEIFIKELASHKSAKSYSYFSMVIEQLSAVSRQAELMIAILTHLALWIHYCSDELCFARSLFMCLCTCTRSCKWHNVETFSLLGRLFLCPILDLHCACLKKDYCYWVN